MALKALTLTLVQLPVVESRKASTQTESYFFSSLTYNIVQQAKYIALFEDKDYLNYLTRQTE